MAILINMCVIFAMYFPEHKHNRLLETLDFAFIVFFLAEAIAKMVAFKPRGYFADNWNRFDFAVVLGSLPGLLVPFAKVPDTSLLILLRMARLARMIRLIRFVPQIDKTLSGVGRALRASVVVILSLFFINLFLAIVTCHFFRDSAPEYFGDPLTSCFSMFQLFTVEGWNEIATVVADRMRESDEFVEGPLSSAMIGLTRAYFAVVVLLGGIFGLSLANAVFVDEMTMDNNNELEAKVDAMRMELQEIKDLIRRMGRTGR